MSPIKGVSVCLWTFVCSPLFISIVHAQGWFHGGDGSGNGNNPFSSGDGNGDGNNNNGPPFSSGQGSSVSASYSSINHALIAHAVIACMVWAFLIPLGGILLRLNIQSPWMLRAHAILQVFSYLAYIVAVGLGIWLIRSMNYGPYFSLWDDAHPKLGMAILVLAFFQPILGAIHHYLFKRQQADYRSGKASETPRRTAPGYVHLWLGRILIVLGIVNGGLGIRLAGQTPLQSDDTTRKAAIGYGVAAGIIFLIYMVFVIIFEVKKTTHDHQPIPRERGTSMEEMPPTYVESQDSLQKDHQGVTRYN